MIVKRVTRVTLSRTTEHTADGLTSFGGTDLWTVRWTTVQSAGKLEDLVQSHYTEKAARRHIVGLLESRVDGLTVDEVYRGDV
jgi:hypothetical protein